MLCRKSVISLLDHHEISDAGQKGFRATLLRTLDYNFAATTATAFALTTFPLDRSFPSR